MDYGRLLGDALNLTWRYRFLWVLGLFAGSSTCSSSLNFNTGLPSGSGFPPGNGFPRGEPGGRDFGFGPEPQRFMEQAGAWMLAHLGLLIAAGVALLVVALVLFAIHFIAEGAIISAIARLTAGQPASLGAAWTEGRRLAWRYVGLWLLGLAVGVAVVGIVAILVGLLVLVGQGAPGAAVALGVLLALVGIVAGIPFFIGAYIVFLFAQRAIAVDDLGPLGGIERGIATLRARLGPSLLLWLLSLAVAIAAGIGMAFVMVIVLIPIVAAVVGSYFAFGLSATLVAVGAGLVAFLILMLWALSAVVNTYTAAYWTLGYLGLTERYPPPAAAGP